MPCSRCDGEMEFTGESFCTYPPCNIHECNKCGYKEEFLGVEYPRIEYRQRQKFRFQWEVKYKMIKEYCDICGKEKHTAKYKLPMYKKKHATDANNVKIMDY